MRRLVLLAVCFATAAWAGEKLLGKIVVTDAGTQSNRTTGATAYAWAGAFAVAPLSKISIQCDQDSYVGTDVATCSSSTCLRIAAGQLLPTSLGSAVTLTGKGYNSDGGVTSAGAPVVTYTGGWVAVAPWNTDGGGTSSTCYVFSRAGTE